jgi:hypothetical protein
VDRRDGLAARGLIFYASMTLDMVRLTIALWVCAALSTNVSIAQSDSLDNIYTTPRSSRER